MLGDTLGLRARHIQSALQPSKCPEPSFTATAARRRPGKSDYLNPRNHALCKNGGLDAAFAYTDDIIQWDLSELGE